VPFSRATYGGVVDKIAAHARHGAVEELDGVSVLDDFCEIRNVGCSARVSSQRCRSPLLTGKHADHDGRHQLRLVRDAGLQAKNKRLKKTHK
jgi:hypothetical protein